jgi:ABC-2 type transport system permease protein
VLRAVLLSAAIVTVFGLLAYGTGALIRHTAGAITAILGVIFLIPLLAQALPTPWFQDLMRWLPGGGALSPIPSSAPRTPTTLSRPGVSSRCSAATR